MTAMECQRVLGRALVAAGHDAYSKALWWPEAYAKAMAYQASAAHFRSKPELWVIACRQATAHMEDCRAIARAMAVRS